LELEKIIREVNPKGVIVQVGSTDQCNGSCVKNRVVYIAPEDIQ